MTSNSLEEIIISLQMLEKHRNQSMKGGNYSESIRAYESTLNLLNNVSRINERDLPKLDELRVRLRMELKYLMELDNEIGILSKRQDVSLDESTERKDPDVWSLPSPNHSSDRKRNPHPKLISDENIERKQHSSNGNRRMSMQPEDAKPHVEKFKSKDPIPKQKPRIHSN